MAGSSICPCAACYALPFALTTTTPHSSVPPPPSPPKSRFSGLAREGTTRRTLLAGRRGLLGRLRRVPSVESVASDLVGLKGGAADFDVVGGR